MKIFRLEDKYVVVKTAIFTFQRNSTPKSSNDFIKN